MNFVSLGDSKEIFIIDPACLEFYTRPSMLLVMEHDLMQTFVT